MYCVNCGVKLGDTEEHCPLCGVRAYHPDIQRPKAEPLYPPQRYPEPQVKSRVAVIFLSSLFLLPLLITLLCDLRINRAVTWSGYVAGALLTSYVWLVLPLWFHKREPVIFVPCGFAAVILFLLYIDLKVQGGWFLGFAFPVAGGIGLIVTAVVVLVRFVRRGRLYIFGGACIALGLFMPVTELLMYLTFRQDHAVAWSMYPLLALLILGGNLLYLAVNRRAREAMERKFFL